MSTRYGDSRWGEVRVAQPPDTYASKPPVDETMPFEYIVAELICVHIENIYRIYQVDAVVDNSEIRHVTEALDQLKQSIEDFKTPSDFIARKRMKAMLP